MKDWLGQEYGVGDQVIYAAMSGRSVTMILAEVVEIYLTKANSRDDEYDPKVTKVKVQPLNSSRWKQHYGRTRYIDTRSGKGIDPFTVDKKTGLYRHCDGGYFENTSSGEKVPEYRYRSHPELRGYRYWDESSIPGNWKLVKKEFKPYVKEIKDGPGPVTLSITKNIVFWRRRDDAERHPEWEACKK